MISPKSNSWTDQEGARVSESERLLSAVSGGALLYKGLSSRSAVSSVLTLVGGYLVYRGVSGNCPVSAQLAPRVPRRGWAVSRDQGVHVESQVVISKPRADVYSFWRSLENLPKFMRHLESVKALSGGHSHWIAKAPLGYSVSWDAEIVGDKENELISWRSLPGADIPNAGTVRFRDAPNGKDTEVHVALKYSPPAGKLGAVLARLLGEEPQVQIDDDLRRFKRLLEEGRASAPSDSEDKVTEASEESFPASDAPGWTNERSRQAESGAARANPSSKAENKPNSKTNKEPK